jgi:hypothetical protein
LRYNNPAVFDPESRGSSIRQRGFVRDEQREQDDDKGPHDDLLVWVVRPINFVQAYDANSRFFRSPSNRAFLSFERNSL